MYSEEYRWMNKLSKNRPAENTEAWGNNGLTEVTGDVDENGNIVNENILRQLHFNPVSENNYKDSLDKEENKWTNESGSPEIWSTTRLLEKYENLRNITLRNIPNLWPGLEFALSVKTILNMKGCTLPFPGIILGPSSSLKTVVIELLRGVKNTFYTDNFSPKSLVSHNSAVKKEKLKEIDLLPKIKNKFFLTPELAPIFSARDDDLLQILGILTRVADGHGYESHTGAQGHRGYAEDIMYTWLGASVDIPHKVHRLLSTLGPKLYFFRLPRIEESEDFYYNKRHESFTEKLHEIRVALLEYLAFFEMNHAFTTDEEAGLPKLSLNSEKDEELAHRIIIRLAKLLAHLRAFVPTKETKSTQGSEYSYVFARIEDPSRAITQLRNLARGHALTKGRNYITEDDLPIVIHTALSTASLERTRIFELLLENKGRLTTSQIVNFLNTTKPPALRTMVELKAAGLVDVMDDSDIYNSPKEISLKSEFNWFLSEQCREITGWNKKISTSVNSTDILVVERGYKENYSPRTPPLFLYDYNIIKKLNLYRKDSLHQNNSVPGEYFSLHPDKIMEGASNRIPQDQPLNTGTAPGLENVIDTTDFRENHVSVNEPAAEAGNLKSIEEITYSCEYCYIINGIKSISSFDSEDSYLRHVVKRHKGWPAYHGPADIEKFKQKLKEKWRKAAAKIA